METPIDFTPSKSFYMNLLEDIIFFLVFYPPFTIILYYVTKHPFAVYKGLLLVIPVILMQVIRNKSKYISLLVLGHIFLITVFFFIAGPLVEKVVYIAFLSITSIISVQKRFATINNFFGWEHLFFGEGILLLCYFISVYFELPFLQSFISIPALLVALAFVAYLHLIKMGEMLDWIHPNSQEMIAPIKKFNRNVTFGFILSILFFIYLTPRLGITRGLSAVLRWGGNSIKRILRFILNRRFYSYRNFSLPTPPVEENSVNAMDDLIEYVEKTQEIIFLEELDWYITHGLVLIAFIIILVILAYVGYMTYKKFHNSTPSNEQKDFDFPFFQTNTKSKTTLKPIFSPFSLTSLLSINEHIRKIYKKKIQQHIRTGIFMHSQDTPQEICKRIHIECTEDLQTLTSIYEKARYASGNCSKDELQYVRKRRS